MVLVDARHLRECRTVGGRNRLPVPGLRREIGPFHLGQLRISEGDETMLSLGTQAVQGLQVLARGACGLGGGLVLCATGQDG